ncbi:hypothetical protein EVAR_90992_1 [Eumeta japonica]|uniref:Uncharacterized protein n=1 Tax=Eumeta variegata TaxID=151549 RepID=A0A4C1Z590_EUMVA|nr:hypothetical protein EVAR_90992_1 [Eumeta japonica]
MATVSQGLSNEDLGEYNNNYEVLAALKNWSEKQTKAGLSLYIAGPVELFLDSINATNESSTVLVSQPQRRATLFRINETKLAPSGPRRRSATSTSSEFCAASTQQARRVIRVTWQAAAGTSLMQGEKEMKEIHPVA